MPSCSFISQPVARVRSHTRKANYSRDAFRQIFAGVEGGGGGVGWGMKKNVTTKGEGGGVKGGGSLGEEHSVFFSIASGEISTLLFFRVLAVEARRFTCTRA